MFYRCLNTDYPYLEMLKELKTKFEDMELVHPNIEDDTNYIYNKNKKLKPLKFNDERDN